MAIFQRAVPVLQVANVETSVAWYADVFGFQADAFPQQPPYSFAILTRDDSEIMLQCAEVAERAVENDPMHARPGWSIYLRTYGECLTELAIAVKQSTQLIRGPERMFYGLVEFEVADPDGYRVCVSGDVAASVNVPSVSELVGVKDSQTLLASRD
jgi:uncharacterized glyoxalase superfamily protein PhnB